MTGAAISRRGFIAGATGSIAPLGKAKATARDGAAGFSAPITAIPFGAHSHWLQPWRPLCRTRSLDEIEAGIGVVIAGYGAAQDALDMLRQQGFRHVRLEIGWGSVEPGTECRFLRQPVLLAYLARSRKAGLRPLILLNANSGFPCPAVFYSVQAKADAPAGARSITLASATGLIPGRSGFSHVGGSQLASVLVTQISGQQIRLSKPLPAAIAAGTILQFVTLSYEPFSQPGSPRNERTLQGWLRYVDLVCQVATAGLGTAGQADSGFDLEIWNELTFGSAFISINNYYDPPLENYDGHAIFGELTRRTADHIAAAGISPSVRLSDGFGNTLPWPAASQEPPRVSAISKHPYPPSLCFPKDNQPSVSLDAFGKTTDFIPSYISYFPEYGASVIQTESLCRDTADVTNLVLRTPHGRLARNVNGHVSPVDVWITELGCSPKQWGITDPMQAARLMTLFALRSLFFHLGTGVGRVYLFEAFGAPGSLALVDQAKPAMPSMALICIARVLSAIRGDANTRLGSTPIPVTTTPLRGMADRHLFEGNGTPNLPAMTTADSLVLLPIQSSPNRIAVLYYVMTRDVRIPLDPQELKVLIQAANIENFALSSYDPLTDAYAPVNRRTAAKDQVQLTLSATDMPKVLLFTS